MRRVVLCCLLLLAAVSMAWPAVQIPVYLMTKPAPPTDCSQPPAVTTFYTTDEAAYLWWVATGASKGDVFATEYYDPSGAFYAPASGPFDPLAEDGDYCFTDLPFYIAGEPPASKPGVWKVIATRNGSQVFTLTFTITAVGPTCTYGITPTSDSIAASGGSGGVLVTTDSSCTWTATTEVTWIHIVSGSSGTGSGTVTYSADANSGGSRTGTLSIAGRTFTLTQAGGSSTGGPTIAAGGIGNAASNRAGKIACGGFFTIYGKNLGPATPQGASYPLQDTLGNVVVNVTRGSVTKRAYLHYISATQINAILPSSMPDGEAQVTVTYQGSTSAPAPVTIIDTSLGIFSTAGGSGPGIIQNYNSASDQPLNSLARSAQPGQIEILWATGLGPINTPDNMPPPGGNMSVPVQVMVGGKNATVSYAGRAPNFAGVDNIYFVVPMDVPQGCSVPVQVKAGSAWSNTVRMAIGPTSGRQCQDEANPFGGLLSNGGKTGGIILLRANLSGQLDSSQPPVNITLDLGAGIFTENKPSGEFAFSPLLSLPPIGTCVSTERALDLASVLADPNSLGLGLGRQLDAGPALQLTGNIGAPVTMKQADAQKTPGLYLALGGSIPIEGLTLPPPFLDGSTFMVKGTGGVDVGPFSATVTMPPKIDWTNRDQLTTINRAAGATVTWSGGDSSQVVLIAGGSTNQKTKDSGGFFCLAPGDARQFAIPVSNLADVPATGATVNLSDSIGALLVVSLPKASQTFAAPRLDTAFGFAAQAFIGVVQFK